MDRSEKLRLSADYGYGHCFKQGLFARFYEQSLYWFSFAMKPLKPMLERVKGGEPVVYGGLPITSFEKLLTEGIFAAVETTEYGWRWPYAAQKACSGNAPPFVEWRAQVLAAPGEKKNAMPCGRDILTEIASFNLATHTPMQAMYAISEWQDALRNREGAR